MNRITKSTIRPSLNKTHKRAPKLLKFDCNLIVYPIFPIVTGQFMQFKKKRPSLCCPFQAHVGYCELADNQRCGSSVENNYLDFMNFKNIDETMLDNQLGT